MSHCIACDRLLTATEAARKYKGSKEEVGLCDHCLSPVQEAYNLHTENPYEDLLDILDEDLGGFSTQTSLDGFSEEDE